MCVRIKLKGSRCVPVYALVKSVPAPVDVQIAETRTTALTKESSNFTSTKRKRTNPQTYKRMRGADYLAKEGFVISNGPWTNLECIVLFAVTEVINYSGVAVNSQNVAELYNFVVSSAKVKEIGLAVTYKPFSSIVGKLSQLNEKHSLHKSLMDSF